MSTDLHVVVPPRLAPGYRLAGAQVDEADDSRGAEQVVRELLDHQAAGVIAVHEPYFVQLPAAWRSRLDPLLVAIPDGTRHEDAEIRRARLTAMLEQAIGHHFVFGERAP
ncbi:MAG: V-type ATP synthase subunit F [Planctomycetota bacterium]|jgi:vacuolar-type H+-ATPase subunit F/Vma7